MEHSSDFKSTLKHNVIVNLLDGGFFGFAIGFASFSTVIPLFVSGMTSSAILIGLVPAIHNMGWLLPQLFSAGRLTRLKRFKPFVMVTTILERIPFLFLALIALFQPKLGIPLALVLTFISLVFQGLGAGVVANAWQNMIQKVIPSEFRSTFFGLQSASSNLLGSLGAVVAGMLLELHAAPKSFFYCFAFSCVWMVVSWIFLDKTREDDRVLEPLKDIPVPLLSSMRSILANNPSFRWYLISRIIWQFGMMAFAFYVVYAVRFLGMSELTAGVMTSVLFFTQVIFNPLAGWLADRWSRKAMLVVGGLATCLSPLLAFLAPSLPWFYPVFVLNGMSAVAFWTMGISYTLELGTDEDRPIYVGMSNTLIAPFAILAPIFGGWLADNSGYPVTFIVSAVFGLLTALLLLFFVHDPKSTHRSKAAHES